MVSSSSRAYGQQQAQYRGRKAQPARPHTVADAAGTGWWASAAAWAMVHTVTEAPWVHFLVIGVRSSTNASEISCRPALAAMSGSPLSTVITSALEAGRAWTLILPDQAAGSTSLDHVAVDHPLPQNSWLAKLLGIGGQVFCDSLDLARYPAAQPVQPRA